MNIRRPKIQINRWFVSKAPGIFWILFIILLSTWFVISFSSAKMATRTEIFSEPNDEIQYTINFPNLIAYDDTISITLKSETPITSSIKITSTVHQDISEETPFVDSNSITNVVSNYGRCNIRYSSPWLSRTNVKEFTSLFLGCEDDVTISICEGTTSVCDTEKISVQWEHHWFTLFRKAFNNFFGNLAPVSVLGSLAGAILLGFLQIQQKQLEKQQEQDEKAWIQQLARCTELVTNALIDTNVIEVQDAYTTLQRMRKSRRPIFSNDLATKMDGLDALIEEVVNKEVVHSDDVPSSQHLNDSRTTFDERAGALLCFSEKQPTQPVGKLLREFSIDKIRDDRLRESFIYRWREKDQRLQTHYTDWVEPPAWWFQQDGTYQEPQLPFPDIPTRDSLDKYKIFMSTYCRQTHSLIKELNKSKTNHIIYGHKGSGLTTVSKILYHRKIYDEENNDEFRIYAVGTQQLKTVMTKHLLWYICAKATLVTLLPSQRQFVARFLTSSLPAFDILPFLEESIASEPWMKKEEPSPSNFEQIGRNVGQTNLRMLYKACSQVKDSDEYFDNHVNWLNGFARCLSYMGRGKWRISCTRLLVDANKIEIFGDEISCELIKAISSHPNFRLSVFTCNQGIGAADLSCETYRYEWNPKQLCNLLIFWLALANNSKNQIRLIDDTETQNQDDGDVKTILQKFAPFWSSYFRDIDAVSHLLSVCENSPKLLAHLLYKLVFLQENFDEDIISSVDIQALIESDPQIQSLMKSS